MSEISIPEGTLLQIANNILNLLEYPSELEREEDLFSDEFYIAIVGNLISDRKFDIQPGNTENEKVKSLKQLVDLLSQIIDMDLSHIDPKGIIIEKDRISAKCLLELIEELIKALINENEEDSQISVKNNLSENNNIKNISDDNILRGNRFKIDSENSDNKIHDKDDEIDMDKILREQKHSNEKKNETKQIQKSDINNINLNSDNNITNTNLNVEKEKENESILLNRSCFEALEFEKILKDAQAKENGEDSYVRKTYSQNDISKYERVLAENEALNQLSNENINYENENENKFNEAPVMNVSNISNLDNSVKKNEKEETDIPNLIEKKNNNEKNNNKNIYDIKNFNDSNLSDNLFNDSIKAYSVPNEYMNKPEISISASGDISYLNENNENKNVIVENSSAKKQKTKETSNSNINISGDLSTKKNSNRKTTNNNVNNIKNNNNNNNNIKTNSSVREESQSDISKSSINSMRKNSTRESKKKISDSNKKDNNNNNNKNKKEILNTSSSLLEEVPLSDEEFKFELMRELRRLYGNEFEKIFPKNNKKQNNEILEIMLKNIKNARTKMMSSENRIPDPDDLLTRDFMHRYQKELQYIINYYKNQKKRKNYLQEQALKTITQNIPTMKKIQEIYNKNIESQIEKKKKLRDEKNHQNQLKLCNEIYSKALEFEKEKYIEETMNENKIKQLRNEAKAQSMMEVEKYYTDKIAILNEILRREKKERENAHKAQVLFLEQISRQKKGEFRKQIDKILQKYDEEDKKNEMEENKNQEQIEKILDTYKK